jgi:hypothetical protein
MGKDTVKVSHGTVTKVDKAGRTVTAKSEDGSEASYRLAKESITSFRKAALLSRLRACPERSRGGSGAHLNSAGQSVGNSRQILRPVGLRITPHLG